MKIALVQAPLVWENPQANRNYFSEKINALNQSVDIIVLPEMFTTGFTMQPHNCAETMTGETLAWMKSLAKAKDCAITGSLIIREDGNFYNRLIFMEPSGKISVYDKRHLFSLAGEQNQYSAGNEKIIIEYKGWKICALICYDLRFPVFSRNTEDYDLLLFVANWPQSRILAWNTLLRARAIENVCYVIGVNRVGVDENDNNYNGQSQAIDMLGNYIVDPREEENIYVAEIDLNILNATRQKFSFLNDRDLFNLRDL